MNNSLRKIFEVYVFAFAFFFAARPLSDGDFWWHLKTGEYILNTRSIPKTDFFSFTNYGKAWVAHEWLSEAIFYAIYSRFGFQRFDSCLCALTALAFWIAFKRSNSHPLIGGTAALLGVWAVLPTIGVRPRVFTLLLSSVYLALLCASHSAWRGPRNLVARSVNGALGEPAWRFPDGHCPDRNTIVGVPLDAWANGRTLSSTLPQAKTLFIVLVGCACCSLFESSWHLDLQISVRDLFVADTTAGQ